MKHPYAHCLKQYMESLSGHYAEITLTIRERRLNQFKKIIYYLNKEKRVSTVSPHYLTSKDIAQLIGYRKKNDLSSDTILDDVSFLDGFLTFCGNNAVREFREEYHRFVPKTYHKRKDCFSDEQFHSILEFADKVHSSGPYRMRAYAVVMFCMCGGLRTLEIQNAKVKNLDRTDKLDKVWLDVVKGVDSYGEPCWAPLLPQSRDSSTGILRCVLST
jgi:site-specific recombinase XerD